MTHDELLINLTRAVGLQRDLSMSGYPNSYKEMRALRAIVELHKPWTSETGIWCRHCEDITDGSEPYPCPTIQAIEEQLK
jgi:hypothetical protein